MATKFREILALCEHRGFVKSVSNKSEFSFGPVGFLLQENLKSEWLNNNLSNRDTSIFLNMDPHFGESFNFVKHICEEKVPFGVTSVVFDEKKLKLQEENENEIDKYFKKPGQLKLQTFIFVSPNTSVQYFYNWQRQRRIWWRKFSASPGRYSLTDIQTKPSGEQNVEIKSTYDWGSHVMEGIFLNPNGEPTLTKEQLEIKDGRKRIQCHCITSTTYLDTMVLNTLCDSYDEPVHHDVKRPLLRLHRKIAPYKISFTVSASNPSTCEELADLAIYLCRKLRTHNVSVLFLPNSIKNSLDAQWKQYDELGIPYCLVLNEGTLANGIAHLRSRDTTLKEQVHVSELAQYVEMLFRNY